MSIQSLLKLVERCQNFKYDSRHAKSHGEHVQSRGEHANFFLGSMGKEKGDNMVNMSTFWAG